jgi:hemerythrin
MALQWTAALATSVGEIDDQHKELFDRVNNLLAAIDQNKGRQEMGKVIQFLTDYVVHHFGTEERYMQKFGYSSFQQHKAQHEQFVKNFLRLKGGLMSGGATPALTEELRQLAVDWLINHIMFSDRALGMYLTKKLPADAPAHARAAAFAARPAAVQSLAIDNRPAAPAALQWNDALSTSVGEIDNQHKELIERINRLLAAFTRSTGREEMGRIVQFLADYVVLHFGTEERYMQKFGYTNITQHKAQHEQFVRSFGRIRDRLLAGGTDPSLMEDTRQLVVDWLVNHIKLSDRALGLYLKHKL